MSVGDLKGHEQTVCPLVDRDFDLESESNGKKLSVDGKGH